MIDYRSKLLKNDSSKDEIDPMIIYCNALKKYGHALYVSGTNLPYGHTAYTHLSYQMINTLDFSKEQFQEVLDNHCHFIQNPIDFFEPTTKTILWKTTIILLLMMQISLLLMSKISFRHKKNFPLGKELCLKILF